MIEALVLGLAYGLPAGIAPGPLLALVITSSLRDGARAGIVVALAPLVTDGVLIAVALTALRSMSDRPLGVMGLIGSLFVLRIAWDTWQESRSADPMADADRTRPAKRGYLRRGILVNALSPHPVVFWLTVGGPTAVRLDADHGALSPTLFVAAFLAMLVGTKALVAVLVGVAHRRIGGRTYRTILAAAGIVLAVLAVALAVESARLFW